MRPVMKGVVLSIGLSFRISMGQTKSPHLFNTLVEIFFAKDNALI